MDLGPGAGDGFSVGSLAAFVPSNGQCYKGCGLGLGCLDGSEVIWPAGAGSFRMIRGVGKNDSRCLSMEIWRVAG